ncbi:MAG: hypothetical protein IKW46_06580, partial [Bacteroidaceae bacterium]|nr:hypothetical protein [Bacteroidaceae bacterium]
LRASNVCDDGSFSSPKECALAPSLAEGCCKATREQKEQTTDFVSAGRFATLPLAPSGGDRWFARRK